MQQSGSTAVAEPRARRQHYISDMRTVKVNKGKLWLRDDEIEGFIERRVTPAGTRAKVNCPSRYIGRKAYLIICKK